MGTRDHKYALGIRHRSSTILPPTCSRRAFLEKTLAGIAMLNATAVIAADDLANLDLHAAASLVRQKKVSPVQLAQACLARIEALNPTLNAFITVTGESALAQARQAEAEVQSGNGEARFTVSRSLSRICSTPQAFGRRAAARCSRIEFQARMPLSSNGFAMAGPSF